MIARDNQRHEAEQATTGKATECQELPVTFVFIAAGDNTGMHELRNETLHRTGFH